MGSLGDILSGNSLKSLTIVPGSIFHGPMDGVDHGKFYIIAGVSGDKLCVCSVVINSKINQFILKRPKLLALQVEILEGDYSFLDHKSYINCANPFTGLSAKLNTDEFTFKDVLKPNHLEVVISNIKASGALTQDEIDLFF